MWCAMVEVVVVVVVVGGNICPAVWPAGWPPINYCHKIHSVSKMQKISERS